VKSIDLTIDLAENGAATARLAMKTDLGAEMAQKAEGRWVREGQTLTFLVEGESVSATIRELTDATLVLERRVHRMDTQTSAYVNSLVKEELAKSTASSVRARLRVMNGGTGGWRKGDVEDALAQTSGEAGEKRGDRSWLNAREA
jgi:hypothetical protein